MSRGYLLRFTFAMIVTAAIVATPGFAAKSFQTIQGNTSDFTYSNPEGSNQSWLFDQWHIADGYQANDTHPILPDGYMLLVSGDPAASDPILNRTGTVRLTFNAPIPNGIFEVGAYVGKYGSQGGVIGDAGAFLLYRDAFCSGWQRIDMSTWNNDKFSHEILFGARQFSGVGAGQYWIEFRDPRPANYAAFNIERITLLDRTTVDAIPFKHPLEYWISDQTKTNPITPGLVIWSSDSSRATFVTCPPDVNSRTTTSTGTVRIALDAIPNINANISLVTAQNTDFSAGGAFSWRDSTMSSFITFDSSTWLQDTQDVALANRKFIGNAAGTYWIELKDNDAAAGSELYAYYFKFTPVTGAHTLSADLNFDGKVDFVDFALFAQQWLLQ